MFLLIRLCFLCIKFIFFVKLTIPYLIYILVVLIHIIKEGINLKYKIYTLFKFYLTLVRVWMVNYKLKITLN
jgi:hypothetical protein